ncbi:MAG: alpha/beta fold hydrolase [Gemmatimonadota bacterium]
MSSRSVRFPGSSGVMLAARLDTPASSRLSAAASTSQTSEAGSSATPMPWALFAHCFTCGKNLKPVVNISHALNDAGFGVFRFDFTGLGESEGDFADTNFSSNVDDLVAAGRFMEEQGMAPALLVGHSLGGAAVLHAAHQLPSVKAVATIGAPADPSHILKHMRGWEDEIRSSGEATVTLGGRPFQIRAQFLDDLEASRMEEAVSTLERALMILHSPVDDTVGIENAGRLFGFARHPRSFISLDEAGHLLLDPRDSSYVGAVIAGWAQRYVASGPDEEPGDTSSFGVPPAELADSHILALTPSEGLRTEVRAGRHTFVSDEPTSVGGSDEGPTPPDLVAAGLAACTTMTLQMYARRKGWPLEEVYTSVRKRRRSGDDPPASHVMEREILLRGDLSEEQRQRLLEIADRCPVHRILEEGVTMRSSLIP